MDSEDDNLSPGRLSDPGEAKRVLVVEDDEKMRELMQNVLGEAGYSVEAVANGLRALSVLAENEPPDLVISDIEMPGMSGIDLLRTLKAIAPTLPVVLMSGLYETDLGLDALRSGAADYLYKPFKPSAVVEMTQRYLGADVRRGQAVLQKRLAELLTDTGGDGLSTTKLLQVFDTLGLKRYETMQHSRRVADYCLLLGKNHGLPGDTRESLRLGALLHDVGKIAIPHNVLMKPGPLNREEWAVMRMHPELGWELLAPFPQLEAAADIVRSHHERWDGGGYSQGLAGERIPIGARIFSVIDTLDALVSDRPYRKGCSIETARAEISGLAGTQFDPLVIESFNSISDLELAEIRRRYPD